MRILIFNSEYPPLGGGAGNASANLARTMARKGHDVAIMTTQYADLPKEEMTDGVLIRRIPAIRKHLDRSGPSEQLSFMVIGSLYALPFVRSWRPDVIIAFFGVPSGAISWLTRLIFGVPYIVSLRGGDVPGFRPYDFGRYHRMIGPFLRRIWRRAGAVVANSGGLRDLGTVFEPEVPIDVIPNGVDIDRFSPTARSWNPGRMLFVGRIVYQKGLDVLFKALKGLLDLDWQMTLVGDGNQRPFLEERARRWEMLDRFHFTGWLTGEAVTEQYQAANLYVASSRHEGMPNVVLEAMASGLPIVATEIAGHDELVNSGVNGMLIPAEDETALRDALRKMLTDPAVQQAMGRASRDVIVQSYTWDKTADAYIAIAERLTAEKAS